MKRKFTLFALVLLIIVSCSPEKKEHISAFEPEEDEEHVVEQENFDHEKENPESGISPVSSSSIETINEEVNEINSPDKLMERQQDIENEIAALSMKIEKTSDPEEKAHLHSLLKQLQSNYNEKQREYLLPANGIEDNIRNLSSRLEKCQTKDEFMRILDPRISYFKNLTKIHTLVEEPARRQEVREMAEALNVLFQKKKAQFRVEY